MATQEERNAMAEVRDALRRGELRHINEPEIAALEEGEYGFNMAFPMVDNVTSYDRHRCGAVGCIGGWMYLAMTKGFSAASKLTGEDYLAATSYVERYGWDGDLKELFYPEDSMWCTGIVNYDSITPDDAAQAIDNFLEYGDPKWPEILYV